VLPQRWRAAVPVVSAVVVVAALSLLTVSIMGSVGADDERASVDAEGSTTTTTTASRRVAPRPTTTTTAAPEVLGETTEREPDALVGPDAPAATATPTPAPPPSTAAPAPAPAPTPAPAPPATAAPPTTAACRNSTDPACGEFSWDPQPGPYEVEVYAASTPIAATVGEPVTFAVEYVDPAGPDAQGACLNWWVSDPAVVNTSSCEVIATSCARTGPHDPPQPSSERILLERTITFETPGEHEVRIEGNIGTHLADGCESPYRNTFTRTFTITVR
jgi:hypothetical protein